MSLNPYACQWKGLWRHGSYTLQMFERDVLKMKLKGELPKQLQWDNGLAAAAAHWLKDMEGCRTIPDQIYDAFDPVDALNEDFYVTKFQFRFENHHRAWLMPMRFPWSSPLEAIFDLLVDDYYEGHPNREAFLSNDFDRIGIACNCHSRFGQICVFEMASDAMHEGEVQPIGPKPGMRKDSEGNFLYYPIEGRGSCEDVCFSNACDIENSYPQLATDDGTKEELFMACCTTTCGEAEGACGTIWSSNTCPVPEAPVRRELHDDMPVANPWHMFEPYAPDCPDKKIDYECAEIFEEDCPPELGQTQTMQNPA